MTLTAVTMKELWKHVLLMRYGQCISIYTACHVQRNLRRTVEVGCGSIDPDSKILDACCVNKAMSDFILTSR